MAVSKNYISEAKKIINSELNLQKHCNWLNSRNLLFIALRYYILITTQLNEYTTLSILIETPCVWSWDNALHQTIKIYKIVLYFSLMCLYTKDLVEVLNEPIQSKSASLTTKKKEAIMDTIIKATIKKQVLTQRPQLNSIYLYQTPSEMEVFFTFDTSSFS